MGLGTSLVKSIAAWALLVVFLVPSMAEFSHIFDREGHTVCQDKTEHMHEATSDCPVCHFQLASFPYELASYPDFKLTEVPTTVEKEYTFLFERFFLKTANSLRAPPQFLG